MNEDKVIQKLTNHDKRFDAVDKRFDAVDKRLSGHDKQFDAVIKKLLEHDEQFKEIRATMATKDDLHEIKETLEVLVTTVNKIADDHVYTNDNVRRLTNRVDNHDVDIKKIKVQLKMA